jgi:hypothetical protein
MKTSSLYSLDLRDLTKGIIIAAASAVITTIQTTLQAGSFDLNWKLIGTVAISAGLAYLGKNFFTSATLQTPITN